VSKAWEEQGSTEGGQGEGGEDTIGWEGGGTQGKAIEVQRKKPTVKPTAHLKTVQGTVYFRTPLSHLTDSTP